MTTTTTTATAGRTAGLRPRVLVPALGVWVLLAAVAILNGIFRGLVLEPALGADVAHVVDSLLVAIPAFWLVVYLYFRYSDVEHTRLELTAIGVLWVGLTVAFEFLFGHYVMGHPWARLLADYDLLAGRVWALVLFAVLVAPLLFGYYLRDRRATATETA